MNVHACQRPSIGRLIENRPARLRSAATWATTRVAAGLQYVCGNRCADGFGILMYHRVAEHVHGIATPTWNVTPDMLRRQLSGLLALRFEPWPLSRLLAARRESRVIPANVFAVTFDDGYENHYLHALPILRELNVPATLFLATKYLDADRPFPFDDWSAAGSNRVPRSAWQPLTTAQCGEMLASGVIELGAHTHSHERFIGRGDEFRRDLELCLGVLRNRFGIERPAFAFPFGESSPELVDAASQLGVTCCFSTRPLRVRSDQDSHQWGRLEVGADDGHMMVAARLSGGSGLPASIRGRLS